MVCGLLQSAKVSLPAWRPFSSSSALQAQSYQRRFQRWLNNERLNVAELSAPILKMLLTNLAPGRVYLFLDTTVLWDSFCQARISLIYRGRALPLAFFTFKHKSSTLGYDFYAPLLDHVTVLLPKQVTVVLLADRGFDTVELMNHCQRIGWHFRTRLKDSLKVFIGNYGVAIKHALPKRLGHAIFYHHVHITALKAGPFHLALGYPKGAKEHWAILSDEVTDKTTFQEYALRFDGEENFLDDKSNGFNSEVFDFSFLIQV